MDINTFKELQGQLKTHLRNITNNQTDDLTYLHNISEHNPEKLLFIAIKYNAIDIIKQLIKQGITCQHPIDNQQTTLLHYAAMNNQWLAFKTILLNQKNNRDRRLILNHLVDEQGNTPLHLAALKGSNYIFHHLNQPEHSQLRRLVNWKQYNNQHLQIAHQAARSNHPKAAATIEAIDQISRKRWGWFNWFRRSLLRQRDNTPQRATPAHYAAQNSQQGCSILSKLKHKLSYGFKQLLNPLEVKDAQNKRPIIWADRSNHSTIVNHLVRIGARFRSLLPNHKTLFHQLANKQYYRIIKDSHLSTEHINNQHPRDLLKTPLHKALETEHKATVIALLTKGADPTIVDLKQETPLHYLAKRPHLTPKWLNNKPINNLLLKPASLNINKLHKTALNIAAEHHNWSLVQHLLDQLPAYKQIQLLLPNTLLSQEPNNTELSSAKSLLQTLNDNDAPAHIVYNLYKKQLSDSKNRNICHWLAQMGLGDLFKKLMNQLGPKEQNDHLNKPDIDGNTPIHLAAYNNQSPIFRHLLNQPDLTSQIGWFSSYNNQAKNIADATLETDALQAQLCLDSYQQMQQQSESQQPKTQSYFVTLVSQLFTNQTTSYSHKDDKGQTILHWMAVRNKYNQFINTVTKSVDESIFEQLNQQDNNGNTPLHLAAMHGNAQLFSALNSQPALLNFIDWSVTNKQGYSIASIAAFAPDESLYDTLQSIRELDHVIKPKWSWGQFFSPSSNPLSQLDDNGKSALHYLAQQKPYKQDQEAAETTYSPFTRAISDRALFSSFDLEIEDKDSQKPWDIFVALNQPPKLSPTIAHKYNRFA